MLLTPGRRAPPRGTPANHRQSPLVGARGLKALELEQTPDGALAALTPSFPPGCAWPTDPQASGRDAARGPPPASLDPRRRCGRDAPPTACTDCPGLPSAGPARLAPAREEPPTRPRGAGPVRGREHRGEPEPPQQAWQLPFCATSTPTRTLTLPDAPSSCGPPNPYTRALTTWLGIGLLGSRCSLPPRALGGSGLAPPRTTTGSDQARCERVSPSMCISMYTSVS